MAGQRYNLGCVANLAAIRHSSCVVQSYKPRHTPDGMKNWPKPDRIRWVEHELDRTRRSPEPAHSGLTASDLEVWLARERDQQSWKTIGDQRFPTVSESEARRSNARRGYDRVNCYMDDPLGGIDVDDVINRLL